MFKLFEKRNHYLTPGRGVYSDDIFKALSFKGYDPENLKVIIGHDNAGNPIFCDIAEAPSLLIAGCTGSGKSVCINTILYELLAHNNPNTLNVYIADPKRVDYIMYEDIPHVIDYQVDSDGIYKMVKGIDALMMRRYDFLAKNKARKLTDLPPEKRPARILLVFDELASMNIKPIIATIENIARLGRATGVHMILATQNPKTSGSDANMTSTLKANCPCKIAFRVDNVHNSMAILDIKGAERLNGKGDGLIRGAGKNLERFQGLYIDDLQLNKLLSFWAVQPLTVADSQLLHNEIQKTIERQNKIFETL